MVPGDVYQSLNSGVLEGDLFAASFQEGFKLYEPAPYFLVPATRMISAIGMAFIRRDLWESLPKEDQDIITKAAEEMQPVVNLQMETYMDESLKRMEKLRCTVKRMTEAETEKFREISTKAWDLWLKDYPEGKTLLTDIKGWLK
jgi:TRAP-type C4-dicarboxylate transport system substrate-binding protein